MILINFDEEAIFLFALDILLLKKVEKASHFDIAKKILITKKKACKKISDQAI